jgi:hypothetical protein
MVWFDCQCGESLKKPAVAKHLQVRQCSFVTCVDCSTTFHGNDFESHIKCISEAQKYMGKLFDADSLRREGAKQDNWIEAVYRALKEYSGPLQHLVDKLAQYDNIPRKQKAFVNFVSNSLNLKRDQSTANKLWDIVSTAANSQESIVSGAPQSKLKAWRSHEEEVREILLANGGSMRWKLLQANLTKRRKTTHPDEPFEAIRVNVLANIPSQFLSDKSSLVSIR